MRMLSTLSFLSLTAGLLNCAEYDANSTPAQASGAIIFGADQRLEYFEAYEYLQRRTALSTALVVDDQYITANVSGYSLDVSRNYGSQFGLCLEEPFRAQPIVLGCTAFVVGPDLIATGGACVTAANCASTHFAFGYRVDGSAVRSELDDDDVYSCTNIIDHVNDGATLRSWTIVQVDRPFVDRPALPIQRTGGVAVGTSLMTAGHPKGLPIKVATGGSVLDDAPTDYFEVNLDTTFGGAIGSPVVNTTTGLVTGILVGGPVAADFYTTAFGCKRSRVCTDTGCSGEGFYVTRSNGFAASVPTLPTCTTNADCDDGEACSGAEVCTNGVCQAGSAASCGDATVCTRDACHTVGGQAVCANDSVTCQDFDTCTVDTCDPTNGCTFSPMQCPAGQSCRDGECLPPCKAKKQSCTANNQCCSNQCVANKCR